MDDVIDVYKKDVDMTLIRENLRLTPDQRLRRMIEFMEYVEGFRAGRLPLVRKFARLLRVDQPGNKRPKKLSNWREYIGTKPPGPVSKHKRAAGRQEDLELIAELEALREEQNRSQA